MPRKTLVLIICAVLALSVLCLAACRVPVITKPDEPGTSTKKPGTEPATPDEGSFGVYKDGKTVAELSLDAVHVLFDGGIFYDLTEEYNEDSSVGTARFHYLSLADGSDTVLRTDRQRP